MSTTAASALPAARPVRGDAERRHQAERETFSECELSALDATVAA